MTIYQGADSYPTKITIPDDGDSEDATSVDVGFEGLADRTEHLRLHSPRVRTLDITATTLNAWTAPPRCVALRIEFWGGGGGGGGGASTGTPCGGGGGGGSARRQVVTVPVTPGTSVDVTIGHGGNGGAINTATTDATNGGADTVVAIHGGAVLATASGAGPGARGTGTMALTPRFEQLALGGTSSKGQIPISDMAPVHSYFTRGPGCGGEGIGGVDSGGGGHLNATRAGSTSLEGYPGGAGGASAFAIGPEGGGGAGGPGGPGGAGGNGGSGAVPANPGIGAAANSGAGGGGGGGCATGGGGIGGGGGDGGSGFCRLIWTEDSP